MSNLPYRGEFVGGFVTPAVKKRLKDRASEQNLSVSLYLYLTLKKLLKVEEKSA